MTIIMLIFALLLILLNLKSYKRLFKTSESINNEFKKSMEESKTKDEQDMATGILVIILTILLPIILSYYIISGIMMTDIIYMTLLASLFGVGTVIGYFKSIQLLSYKYEYGIFSRILVPIATFYHVYFIAFLLGLLG